MKKILYIVIIVVGLLSSAFASPVNEEDARLAVVGWLNGMSSTSSLQLYSTKQATKVDAYSDTNGVPQYYVVNLDPQGFVVVIADDFSEPIVAFVGGGTYDPSIENPLGALIANDVPQRMQIAQGLAGKVLDEVALKSREKWSQLLAAARPNQVAVFGLASISDVLVAPLLETVWSQTDVSGGACYNYYTPPNDAGRSDNYPCGCVATAMAQVMRLWKYPTVGVGTASFNIVVDDVPESRSLRGGDGSGRAYQWSDMHTNPQASSTLAQRQAIGALCSDAGITVMMSYTATGSGAYVSFVPNALTNIFHYSNAIYGNNNTANIGAGLNEMINPNLDAGCPVILGVSGDGGHAIVCDGYGYNLATLYHHLNMGWAGSDDVWYNLPDIGTQFNFNVVDECVYNIWTNGTGEIISGRVTDMSGNAILGATVTALRDGGGSFSDQTDIHGIYALVQVPSASQYTVSVSYSNQSFSSKSVSTATSLDRVKTSGNKWGINFMPEDPSAPHNFVASTISASKIELSWLQNDYGDSVIVAFNANANFGTPSGSYSVGDSISGGGTVIYSGGYTNFMHIGLTSQTKYYYKVWSILAGPSYSGGVVDDCSTFLSVPFQENFENNGMIPDGWTQEFVVDNIDWDFGSPYGNPDAAHEGSFCASLVSDNTNDHKTKLVSPMIDFDSATLNPQLTFWHYMEEYSPDQDELRVFYKTSLAGSWIQIEEYTTSTAAWTERTISLPNVNSSYYIAFEGNAKWGYGVFVDEVNVTAEENVLPPDCTLMVVSPWGGVFPGTITTNHDASVVQWITNSPCYDGVNTQYVCLAGVVAGNDYTSISQTNITLSLTNDATLSWQWSTNYWLDISATEHGNVSTSNGWEECGTNINISAQADDYYHFANWSGNTNAIVGGSSTSSNISIDMISAISLQANFAQNLSYNDTPEHWFAQFGWTSNFNDIAILDSDNDGLLAWEEYQADTLPDNPNSVLKIENIVLSNGNWQIKWQGGVQSWQILEVCSNMTESTPQWITLFTNTPPTATSTNIPLDEAFHHKFYRIRAWRQ